MICEDERCIHIRVFPNYLVIENFQLIKIQFVFYVKRTLELEVNHSKN